MEGGSITDTDVNGNCSIYNATMLAVFLNNAMGNRTIDIQNLLKTNCRYEVCSLAWGSPNPDLSGIGTVVSYMVQTALIALFGVYLIVPEALAKLGFKYPEKIHRRFRAANFLMAISFFVAEVWHLSQSPGLVETDFMRMLAELQAIQYTIITYGVVATLGAFGEKTSHLSIGQLLVGGDRLRIMDLFTPLFSIAYLVLDGSHYGDRGSWQQDVADACPDTYNRNEVLAAQDADIQGVELSCVRLKYLMSFVLFRYTYIVAMAAQLLYGIVFGIFWYGSGCFAPSDDGFRAHVKRHKKCYVLVPKLGLAICILLTAALILGLWLYRTCVDKVQGDREDSQWGIGQVLAPAAWVPSILDIAAWMYGCLRRRGREFKDPEGLRTSADHFGNQESRKGM